MKTEFRVALIWAGLMLAVAMAARFAHELGYIDHDSVLRIVAMNGLMIVYYGNLIPKKVIPSASIRQLARVSGWSQVLSGLIFFALWAFAPIPLAATVGTGAVAASLIVTLGYAFWLHRRAKGHRAVL